MVIADKLLNHFDEHSNLTSLEHIARVVLSWVNNHYNDFETNIKLYEFLEVFDDRLQHHEKEVKNKVCVEHRNDRILLFSKFDHGDI